MIPEAKRLRKYLGVGFFLTLGATLWGICANPSSGPDIVVAQLYDLQNYVQGTPIEGKRAYAVGTKSLNVGNQVVRWQASTIHHPVIGQNLYRYRVDSHRPGGRFEQIGMSWLKHGFTALAQSEFCSCDNPGTGSLLGTGCSDPYSGSLNGSNSSQGTDCGGSGGSGGLGARSEVNPTTGLITYPYQRCATGNATLRKRLIVDDADLDPTPGVRYFIEGQYVSDDDALAGNGLNNASFREVVISNPTSKTLAFATSGPFAQTQRTLPALAAWPLLDSSVQYVELNTAVRPVQRFHVARKVHDYGNGTFRHELAVHNFNSVLAGRKLTVRLPQGASIFSAGFKDIDHHSGEPYSTADWSWSIQGSEVSWETDPHDVDPNANALRWGTMFNFWLETNVDGSGSDYELELFAPGCPKRLRFGIPNAVIFSDDFDCGSTGSWGSSS